MERQYDTAAFAWAYLLNMAIGLLGVLAYAYPIGQRYFNVRYLALMPLSASFLAFLVFAGGTLAFKYIADELRS